MPQRSLQLLQTGNQHRKGMLGEIQRLYGRAYTYYALLYGKLYVSTSFLFSFLFFVIYDFLSFICVDFRQCNRAQVSVETPPPPHSPAFFVVFFLSNPKQESRKLNAFATYSNLI